MPGHNTEPFVLEHTKLLGRLDARTETMETNQQAQTALLLSIDGRLRSVEVRSAINGLIAGVGATLLVETVKAKLGLAG